MAVSGNIFYIDDNNKEDFATLCKQLAGLVRSASTDFENIVASGLINPWAKNKPFRYNDKNFGYDFNNPAPAEARREEARALVSYGMYVGSDHYWHYLHPRGSAYNEPNRIRDFDGYNHAAEPPLASTTRFNKSIDLSTEDAYLKSEVTIYPSDILAKGVNVELPLNNLMEYPSGNYLGLIFENQRSGAKWYHSFDFTLAQLINGTYIEQSYYTPLADMPNTNNGDKVDVYYCLTTSPNVEYGAVYNGMIYFAMDKDHGHFLLSVSRFTLDAFGLWKPSQSGAGSITYSYGGSNAVISSVVYDCQLNYRTSNSHFEQDTEYQFYVNGNAYGSKATKTLRLSDIQAGTFTVTKTQSVSVSASDLANNDYRVEVECRAYLAGNTDYKVVMKYQLDVTTGRITNLI